MSKTRYEISIAYTDAKGSKRFVNGIGSLFFDGEKGSIVLPPGVALVGGTGYYINVAAPFQRDGQGGGAGQHRDRGNVHGKQQQESGGGYGPGGDDDIPFAPLRGEI